MLQYCLVENQMTNKTADFVAHVSNLENKTMEDVIDFMIAEGSGLTSLVPGSYQVQVNAISRNGKNVNSGTLPHLIVV